MYNRKLGPPKDLAQGFFLPTNSPLTHVQPHFRPHRCFNRKLAPITGVPGDLLQGVEVPLYGLAGGRVNVSCNYDLRATGLYSLKWYHNDTEFYRYVPTETHRPVDIKPSMKFQAHVSIFFIYLLILYPHLMSFFFF